MSKNTSLTHLILLFAFRHSISPVYGASSLAPALFVFGDSLFDSGNNNFLPTIAKANFLPYGVNFAMGVTGRFTNGRTVPDFLAEFLGLPYPPPYMGVRESTPVTGLNYASASCGILPETGSSLGKCLNLGEQVNLFEETVKHGLPQQFKGANDLSEHLSKSILVFSIGSNDYLNNYLAPNLLNSSKLYTSQEFAQLLLGTLFQAFQKLYHLGARKFVMFEIGPIGCIPSVARKNKEEGKCAEESNHLVSYFNDRLPEMLEHLTATLQGSIFGLGHANWLGYDAIMNPSGYGIMDTRNPCCRTWGNGTSACIPWLSPCPNPNKHYFFDAFHLTESVCSTIAARCINDSSVCSPVIQELVQM